LNKERRYRSWKTKDGLIPFRVAVNETDLYILAQTSLEREAREAVLRFRHTIEEYIKKEPLFKESMTPLPLDARAPEIVSEMLRASQRAKVGPMAGVAGAIAEFVGKTLLAYSPEVVVENGGDIFLHIDNELTAGIFAGRSPLSNTVGIRIPAEKTPLGICTSSGTVGHSQSFGKADAVCVISRSATLADAVATSLGNMVQDKSDIETTLQRGRRISGVEGIVIIVDDTLGVWGYYELAYLS